MLVWITVALFLLVAILLIVERRRAAEAQEVLAGITAFPIGCVVAEALFCVLIAGVLYWAHRAGMLGP